MSQIRNAQSPDSGNPSVQAIHTKRPFQTGKVSGLAFAHFLHDLYTSLLAPTLPLLIQRLSLSLTEAGSLTVFMQLPNLFNPLLGLWADKKRLQRLFMVLSPSLTALGMCLIGSAPNFGALVLLLLAAGLSSSLFHVSTPVMAARLSGSYVGRGMGFFMLGGEAARTTGPLLAVWALSTFGLEGLWKLMVFGILASLFLWIKLGIHDTEPKKNEARLPILKTLSKLRRLFLAILGIVLARSFIAAMISTYLPTFLTHEGHSLALAGASLAIVEAAGAAGVLTSGWLSDLLGRRRILVATILIAPLMLMGILSVEGWLLVPFFLGLGFFTLSTGPVMMAMVMEQSGENQATANGIYMAFSLFLRSLVILLVGYLSDQLGMHTALWISAFIGFLGLPFILLLPKSPVNKTNP